MFRITLLALALVFGAANAQAGDLAAASADCNQIDNPDLTLSGCTELIDVHKVKDLNLAVAYFRRGLAYDKKKDYTASIGEYTKALDVKSDLPILWFKRGLAHARTGQYALAVADYTKAIELDPKDADAVSNRGRAYYSSGEKDKAIADWRAALVIDPKHETAKGNLKELGLEP
jgi:tetratricopeptide (TPR) repeat protein